MSAWIAFGFGILLGALLLDQLWRWLYRVSRKLISEQGEYIVELEDAIAIEAQGAVTTQIGTVPFTSTRPLKAGTPKLQYRHQGSASK